MDNIKLQDFELRELIQDGELEFPHHENQDEKVKIELTGDAEMTVDRSLREVF